MEGARRKAVEVDESDARAPMSALARSTVGETLSAAGCRSRSAMRCSEV